MVKKQKQRVDTNDSVIKLSVTKSSIENPHNQHEQSINDMSSVKNIQYEAGKLHTLSSPLTYTWHSHNTHIHINSYWAKGLRLPTRDPCQWGGTSHPTCGFHGDPQTHHHLDIQWHQDGRRLFHWTGHWWITAHYLCGDQTCWKVKSGSTVCMYMCIRSPRLLVKVFCI